VWEKKAMMTLRQFETIPATISWCLTDLGEARGRQELFTRQSPQRLKALREHAMIESAVSSNRIEGIEGDRSRIAIIVLGTPLLRDRDEEEIRGYRQALRLIHEQGANLPLTQESILNLHRLSGMQASTKKKMGTLSKNFPMVVCGRVLIRFRRGHLGAHARISGTV
jgi:Fic family protein